MSRLDKWLEGRAWSPLTRTGCSVARAAPRVVPALAVAAAVLLAGPASGTSASTARLGDARVGASFDQGGAGYLDVSGPFRTNGGTVAALAAYVRGESLALSVRGVVYADAGGRPGRLVGASRAARVAAGAAGAWVRLPLRGTARLARGGYWLGFWYGPGTGSGTSGGFAYSTAKGRERYAPAAYSPTGSPPAGFPTGAASSSSSYSIYASLAVSKPAVAAPKKKTSAKKTVPKTTVPKTTVPKKKTAPTKTTGAKTTGAQRTTKTSYEDTREGFPKVAAYRPGCSTSAAQAARLDWFVTDGSCDAVLDAAHALNRHLLGMIQPSNPGNGDLFAATYGQYDLMRSPVSDPAIGAIRAFQQSDWLHDTNGGVHAYESVNVLNWLSRGTALWSADVVAYWAKRDGALGSAHPGIMGIWGDNDFWSDQSYAFTGTPLDATAANRATWDTNVVAHHDRLAHDLPGLVIGGNDIASYAADPGSYRGSPANGWLLPGVSAAGMRECADRYFGLRTADGIDSIIASAQRFLAGEALDGKQRYLMLNDCDATSDQNDEYGLAVATIAGMYYWPYRSGAWDSTLTIAPAIPDVTRNGRRNWLGAPVGPPAKLASGLWKRTFQHGVVYANMTGSTRTVDGHALADGTGLFVST